MQNDLFELEPQTSLPEERKDGLTCKSCNHRQRWQCNSKVFQYCGARKSNRTNNKLLKIRCKDAACELYDATGC